MSNMGALPTRIARSAKVVLLEAQVEAKVSASQQSPQHTAFGALHHKSDYDEENDRQPS